MARAPTSGTRHGNGAGWGGPAKGSSTARKEMPVPGPGVAGADIVHRLDVEEMRASYDEIFAQALARTVEGAEHVHARLMAAAGDVSAAQLAQASARLQAEVMDRTRGKPIQATINANTDDLDGISEAVLDAIVGAGPPTAGDHEGET